jgi:hypothetical protein
MSHAVVVGIVAGANHARPRLPTLRADVEPEDALVARRRQVAASAADLPLARVAALLVSIAHNNTYEGRDPNTIPDTLTSGFVADLLGFDVTSLAAQLVELERRGLIDSSIAPALRLKSLSDLEALADAN